MTRLKSRRRAWQAAISPGELHASFEPGMPELLRKEREPGELKHLSSRRKRKQLRCREYRREKAAEGKPNPLAKASGDVVFGPG